MLSDTTLFCLAYLTDEQIEANGGIPSASLAAMREDTIATAEFAHSYLVGTGILEGKFSEMPEYPDFYWGDGSMEENLCKDSLLAEELLCPEL